MPEVITLTADYGYEAYKISGLTNTTINATDASWIVANIGSQTNPYPVSVRDSVNVTLMGGTIAGQVPLDLDWVDAYVNSAALYARDVDNILIQDWKVSQTWDAIRISGSGSDTFTIDNVWLTNVRDDGIENDNGLTGTLSNSLFDGVFVGISLSDSDTGDKTDNVVTLDNVLIRMESFQYKGELTHESIFKVEAGVSPSLNIHDSIFAIEDVNHKGQGRLEIAWNSVISASNNYFLNLSDDPLPKDYPKPPAGFIILQGAEARAFWQNARNDWIAEHNQTIATGEVIAGTSGADTLTGTALSERMDGLRGNDDLSGMAGEDKLSGHKGNDILRGGNQDDMLNGGEGSDVMTGGDGADKFVFRAMGADQIKDFALGIDTLEISKTLTGGMTDTGQIISAFASVVGTDVVFDFGHGNSIVLAGLGSTSGLSGDLMIF
jgi:RTX calcium-binding nonapeptide repeat (4 copies)